VPGAKDRRISGRVHTLTRGNDAFPLYYASLGGFYDLAEHLVGKHPEQINARGGQMVTPLVAALRRKHFQVAELLHRNGADLDVREREGDTPLREACRAGIECLDIAQWLLDHGADVNAQGYYLYGPHFTLRPTTDTSNQFRC
jgi:ankyrin repeat protein